MIWFWTTFLTPFGIGGVGMLAYQLILKSKQYRLLLGGTLVIK